jgi:hypothetical protein
MKLFLLIMTILIIIIIGSSISFSTFAHNGSTIAIRVARQPIIIDGVINDIEWEDASKINFTSPRLNEGNVIVYLKYELLDKV